MGGFGEKERSSGVSLAFHNTSKLDFQKLKGDPDKTAQNLSPRAWGSASR